MFLCRRRCQQCNAAIRIMRLTDPAPAHSQTELLLVLSDVTPKSRSALPLVGAAAGDVLGATDGEAVSPSSEGDVLGDVLGNRRGVADGVTAGDMLGVADGVADGDGVSPTSDGDVLGDVLGDADGAAAGAVLGAAAGLVTGVKRTLIGVSSSLASTASAAAAEYVLIEIRIFEQNTILLSSIMTAADSGQVLLTAASVTLSISSSICGRTIIRCTK